MPGNGYFEQLPFPFTLNLKAEPLSESPESHVAADEGVDTQSPQVSPPSSSNSSLSEHFIHNDLADEIMQSISNLDPDGNAASEAPFVPRYPFLKLGYEQTHTSEVVVRDNRS